VRRSLLPELPVRLLPPFPREVELHHLGGALRSCRGGGCGSYAAAAR
jgi:hypothetical protein